MASRRLAEPLGVPVPLCHSLSHSHKRTNLYPYRTVNSLKYYKRPNANTHTSSVSLTHCLATCRRAPLSRALIFKLFCLLALRNRFLPIQENSSSLLSFLLPLLHCRRIPALCASMPLNPDSVAPILVTATPPAPLSNRIINCSLIYLLACLCRHSLQQQQQLLSVPIYRCHCTNCSCDCCLCVLVRL